MNKKEIMNRYAEVLNEKKEAFEEDKVEKSKKISRRFHKKKLNSTVKYFWI